MTQSMYLVSVSHPQIGARILNGVTAVLVNASGTTNATANALLAAAAAANPAFENLADNANDSADTDSEFYQSALAFPANYFDTAVIASSSGGVPGSGNGSVAGDAYIFGGPNVPPKYVDHTKYTPV